MEVRDVLEGALETLEERGWAQGQWEDYDGSVCAARAIYLNSRQEMQLCVQAQNVVRTQVEERQLFKWNDHPDRTFSQVKEVFRRAIAECGGVARERITS